MKGKNNQGFVAVLIGLGSNLSPEFNILKALSLLDEAVTIRKSSGIYQSPAVGSTGPDYLNSAALVYTDLTLEELKKDVLIQIEKQLKRRRSADKYMDRTIDLDVLIYDAEVIDSDLWTQAHIALPAADILPNFLNPDTGEKISQAAMRLVPGINISLRSDLS